MKKEEIKNLVKDVLEKLTIPVNEILVSENSNKTTWFLVEVSNPKHFTDRDGEALLALNHLVRRVLENKFIKDGIIGDDLNNALNIFIDINNFQKNKADSVRSIAHMMAERARYFKASVEIDPMSSFDRRIVHEFLSDAVDLKTESIGFGPSRRVVIKYLGSI